MTLRSMISLSSVDRAPARCSGGHRFDSGFFSVPGSCHVNKFTLLISQSILISNMHNLPAFSLVLVSIKKTYQLLIKNLFDHISKFLEFPQNCSAGRLVANFVRGACKCDQTRSFLFDILHKKTF